MATHQLTAFERVFPNREFARGTPLLSLLWSSCGTVFLCLLFGNLYLIADLLASGGMLQLPAKFHTEVAEVTGQKPDPEESILHKPLDSLEIRYTNRGILPAVWWGRNHLWGAPLVHLYKRIPALRDNSEALLLLVLTAAGLWFAQYLAYARARALSMRVALDISSRLRMAIHRQALRLGPGDLDGRDQEHVLNLFTSEVDRLRDAICQWVEGVGRNPFQILLLAILTFCIHPLLTVQCVIPLGLCWYVAQQESQRLQGIRQQATSRSAAEFRLLGESLSQSRLVRGYGMEEYAQEQFEKHLERFQQNAAVAMRAGGVSGWSYRGLLAICTSILAYLIGSKILVTPEHLSFAAALLFVGTVVLMYIPLQSLWKLRLVREDASQAAIRIHRYLNRIPEVGQAVGAKFLQPLSRDLEFDSVTYTGLDKKRLLDGISLKIKAGQQVAIISTEPREALALVYLLPRFIEQQSGHVLVDGEDIAWVTLESLRAETIYVGGNDSFFTGTVLENIRGGQSNYTLTEVTEAAKMTHAHNFILKLSQGYETVIGEHGEQLDPGQSFRLGLARAVLRNPALLIVEEPSKPMDEDTKSLIDDAYQRINQNRTVLFLPTRMSSLRRADEIILLHQGKVVAVGSHVRLVQTSEFYRHWEYLRFNQFRRQAEENGNGSG